MRWWVFLLMATIAVGLDSGLAGVFTLRGLGHATPGFSACLLAFIALQARPHLALWAAWVIGLLLDLSPGSAGAAGGVVVIGPHTLGCVAGAWGVLLLRNVVFRRRIVTVAVVSGLVMASIGLVAAAVETVRWWMPWTNALAPPPPALRLATITASSVYTMLVGLPVAGVLLLTLRWWRFDAAPGRLDYASSRR